MDELTGIYKTIQDSLNDAWVQYDYAKKAVENKWTEVARFHIDEGLARIESLKIADRLFVNLASKYDNNNTNHSLWKLMYYNVIEDAEMLEQKLNKMKI